MGRGKQAVLDEIVRRIVETVVRWAEGIIEQGM